MVCEWGGGGGREGRERERERERERWKGMIKMVEYIPSEVL